MQDSDFIDPIVQKKIHNIALTMEVTQSIIVCLRRQSLEGPIQNGFSIAAFARFPRAQSMTINS